MKVKIQRLSGKPVEPEQLKLFKQRFVSRFDELTKEGNPTDQQGWQALNSQLDAMEDQLKNEYPAEIEIDIRITDLKKLVEKFGPYSVYLNEDDQVSIAIIQDPI